MASALKLPVEEIQAANLAVRSDFQNFVSVGPLAKGSKASVKKAGKAAGTASAVALAARDTALREVLQRYQTATPELRKKFVRAAMQLL
jgi:hypothetical protein